MNAEQEKWVPMTLTYVGHVHALIQMPGGGKISASQGDPGDPRKPSGQG